MILFFCAAPINMLIGTEFISVGIYYVEYVEYFEVSRATVGLIMTVRSAVVCLCGTFVT